MRLWEAEARVMDVWRGNERGLCSMIQVDKQMLFNQDGRDGGE